MKKWILIVIIVLTFLLVHFFIVAKRMAEEAFEAEKNLIACRTVSFRIIECIKNNKWPPSWDDIEKIDIHAAFILPFGEIKRRVTINLPNEVKTVLEKYPVGTITTKDFPKLVRTNPPRFVDVEHECNLWILNAIRKSRGLGIQEQEYKIIIPILSEKDYKQE